MNILFLMADEFRFDAGGFGDLGIGETPCLDRLVEGAAVFKNACTPSPVCVPARQCLATGQYPRSHGCLHFGEDLSPGAPTFARHFAQHGYYTVACGKLHHRGPDQMQGWLHRIGSEQAVNWPEAFADRPQIGRQKWRGAAEILESGEGISPLGLADELAIQGACDFLRMHFSGKTGISPDVPVFLKVSLQQPHFPLLAPKDLLEKYLPRVSLLKDCGPCGHALLDEGRLPAGGDVSEFDLRRAVAAYAAMVEQTDRRFARVLEAIRSVGSDPGDWLVVFTSDHGEMLGEHGHWGKRKFYEGSVRVPLILRGPGIPAGVQTIPANLVDLFPTLCRLAGLPVPEDLDGKDLFDPMSSRLTFSQLGSDQFMVRDERWKLMVLPEGGDVLFDLEGDPGETCNLISHPDHQETVRTLRAALRKLMTSERSKTPKD